MQTIQRFFTAFEMQGGSLSIHDPAVIYQITHVMRGRVGDHIVVLDDSGCEYEVEITILEKKRIGATIRKKELAVNEPLTPVFLYQSLLKSKERFEFVLQKGTEVGAAGFIPLRSERCELKGNLNAERMNAIIREAAEQSHRGRLPVFQSEKTFHQAVSGAPGIKIVFDGSAIPFRDFLQTNFPDKDQRTTFDRVSLFIGPEGGFSPQEIATAKDNGSYIVSLGKRVLRSETAGIIASALILEAFDGHL